jgi:hypothetical protein
MRARPEGANQLWAGDRDDFRGLSDAQLDLALGDQLRRLRPGNEYGFGFQLVGDAEMLDCTRSPHAAQAALRRIRVRDRFRGEQRLFEGFPPACWSIGYSLIEPRLRRLS